MKKAPKEIVCIAKFTAKKGKETKLLESLHKLISPTHKEKGCIRYELNQSIDNPSIITFIEKFASQQAFDDHCNMPYITDYFENTAPNLVAEQDISLHKEILP